VNSLNDAHILIVDDQESNILLIETLLKKDGYTHVTSTTRSAEVAGLFATSAPDLLLLDLQMPEPDGFAVMKLVERWTTAETYVPILVLTADANRETRRRALEAGARDFLTKPFDADEVATAGAAVSQ
jgi:CheY-like chemotaxis protein